jgi:hypothetical protein
MDIAHSVVIRKLPNVILSPSINSGSTPGRISGRASSHEILRRAALSGTPQNDNRKISFQIDTVLVNIIQEKMKA